MHNLCKIDTRWSFMHGEEKQRMRTEFQDQEKEREREMKDDGCMGDNLQQTRNHAAMAKPQLWLHI